MTKGRRKADSSNKYTLKHIISVVAVLIGIVTAIVKVTSVVIETKTETKYTREAVAKIEHKQEISSIKQNQIAIDVVEIKTVLNSLVKKKTTIASK